MILRATSYYILLVNKKSCEALSPSYCLFCMKGSTSGAATSYLSETPMLSLETPMFSPVKHPCSHQWNTHVLPRNTMFSPVKHPCSPQKHPCSPQWNTHVLPRNTHVLPRNTHVLPSETPMFSPVYRGVRLAQSLAFCCKKKVNTMMVNNSTNDN